MSISMSTEEENVSVEVTRSSDVADNDEYSFAFDVSSLVFRIFVSVVLKMN